MPQDGAWDNADPPDAVATRRVLGREERARLWQRLQERWGPIQGYWYAFNGKLSPPNVLMLRAWPGDAGGPLPALRRLLGAHSIRRVWVLHNAGPLHVDYEIECGSLAPTGSEEYITGSDMDWLIYCSHEDTISVGGDWLIASLQASWPPWRERLYTPPGRLLSRPE